MDSGVLKAIMHGWANIASFTSPALGYVYSVTMSLIALWTSIGLAINLGKHYKMDKSWVTVAVSVASFMITATMNKEGTLVFDYLDGKGLFVAILVTIVSVGYINLEGGGVPPALAESIGNLVPIVIVLVAVATVNAVLLNFTGVEIPAIMQLIMTPIVNMVDSIWGVVILALIVMIFWWFGIHDTVITGPLDTFLMNNFTANQAAFAAGTAAVALPYIVTEPFWWTFMAIGGSGATLGLAILTLFSKSKQLKTIGKIAIIPSLFNINEPLIFGLPLMYNSTMMLPFILVMPLNGVITYIAMNTGIVAKTFAYASWNMFCPIGGLIDTMDIKALILICALIVIDIIIYFPFFKIYEKQKIKEEVMEESTQA